MRLTKLKSIRYTVAAPLEQGEISEVQQFLMDVAPDMTASAKGMLALFDRYAADGRKQLPATTFHEANKQEAIWEFVKGRLRIYCFMDSNEQLIVLSHGAVKKTQKAVKQEVDKAIRLKRSYLIAKQQGSIEWIQSSQGEAEDE